MEGSGAEGTLFLGWNFILISLIGLVIFGYFIMLVRKRWKHNFLHSSRSIGGGKKE